MVGASSSFGNDMAREELRDRSRDGRGLLDVQQVSDARDRALLDVRHR
jgi:hypothetical protein